MPTESAHRADEPAAETRASKNPQYRAAREAFDKLEPADKAAFLLDSAFGSAGELVAEAARAVGDIIERAGESEFWRAPEGGAEAAGQGAARPRRKAPPADDMGGPA
jgi:hypothetical protein